MLCSHLLAIECVGVDFWLSKISKIMVLNTEMAKSLLGYQIWPSLSYKKGLFIILQAKVFSSKMKTKWKK